LFDTELNQKVNFLGADASKFDVKWWNKSDPIWLSAKDQVGNIEKKKF